jgi:hypothetical protein
MDGDVFYERRQDVLFKYCQNTAGERPQASTDSVERPIMPLAGWRTAWKELSRIDISFSGLVPCSR